MADTGSFLIGAIAIGAGIGASALGLGFLAAPLFAYGTGKIIDGLLGSPTQHIEGRKINRLSTQAPVPIVYGRARIGIKINDTRIIDSSDPATPSADPNAIFIGAVNGDILGRSGALCVGSEDGSGIEAIEEIRFYGDQLAMIDPVVINGSLASGIGILTKYANHLAYHAQLGTDAQQNHLDIRNHLGWGTNMDGRGLAYFVFFMRYDTDLWRGIPPITALIKGNKLYDPRTSTWLFPNYALRTGANPALVILDYLTSKRYGGGVPYAARDGGSLDFIDEQSFIDMANYCEQAVSIPPSGTEDRFGFNGAVDPAVEVGENLADMLASCRGELIFQSGKYKLVIRQVTTAETYELTEDRILEIEWTRKGADIPNSIQAAYVESIDGDYVVDTVIWPLVGDTTLLDEDNGVENRAEVVLQYTTGRLQATRTAMVLLREARQDVFANILAVQGAFQYEVGNVVLVTHEAPGWVQQPMMVRQIGVTVDGKMRLGLQKYDAAVYSLDTLTAQPATPTTNLPDPFTIADPTGVTSIADSTTVLATQDGLRVPRIKTSWTAVADPFLSHYELRFKVTADADFTRLPDANREDVFQFIWPVTSLVDYTSEVRAVNTVGAVSDWVTSTVTVATVNKQDFLPPFEDLEWYGQFDEGAGVDLRDRSGNARHALQETGGATIAWVPGITGMAVDFPGSGVGYKLLTDAQAGAIEGLFYVSGWFSSGSVLGGPAARIISRGSGEYFDLALNQGFLPQDLIFGYSDTQSVTLSGAVAAANVNHFFLAQWDQTLNIVEFWLGNQVTGLLTLEFRSESLAAFSTATRVLGIASSMTTVPTSANPFEGTIDDVKVGAPPALLDQPQILAIFQNPGVEASPGSIAPMWETEFDRDAQGNATLTLTINDPSGAIIAPGPQFSKRPGSQAGDVWGVFSAVWDTEPSNPPYGGVWIEALVIPTGEEAGIRWQYSYIDEDGNTQTVGLTHYTSGIDENQVALIFPLDQGNASSSIDDAYTLISGGAVQPANANDPLVWMLPIPVPLGVIIEEVDVRLFRDAVGDTSIATIQRGDINGVPTQLASFTGSTGGWSTQSNTAISETVIADRSYHAQFAFIGFDAGADARGAWVRIVYDRPTSAQVY